MKQRDDSQHPLSALADEVARLQGRLKHLFAPILRELGLGESELTVLTAVVEAERPPTVPQIGRSLGHARQLVQRAANSLADRGLIELLPNPDHKRAALLRATEAGVALKRRADAEAGAIARNLGEALDLAAARDAAALLRALCRQLAAPARGEDPR
ncbi:MAG TPA: MarR family transcriptional regulator [Reyranella sp.]|nr:MarR family transcriptional regulator [Reyranella sp.]